MVVIKLLTAHRNTSMNIWQCSKRSRIDVFVFGRHIIPDRFKSDYVKRPLIGGFLCVIITDIFCSSAIFITISMGNSFIIDVYVILYR